MRGLYTLPFILTATAGCGSGATSPIAATPTEVTETKVVNMPVVPVDAGVAPAAPDAGLTAPIESPHVECADGTTPAIAPVPDATYFCQKPDGTRDGPFVTLFPDGSVAITGAYKNGKLDGLWQRRYPSGAMAETGTYVNGVKDGEWTQRKPNGEVLGTYKMKLGTGTEELWYDDGPIYRERQLLRGVPYGKLAVFDHDGQVALSAKLYYGRLDGPRVVGGRNTLRIEETFTNGTRHDARQIWQFWQLVVDENYDDKGKLDGAYTIWRDKKIPRVQGTYDHGQRNGTWSWFDRNNNKEREGDFADGKKTGAWFEWSENKLTFSGQYTDGKPDGDFIYYDKAGNELGRCTLTAGTGTMLTFYSNHRVSSKQAMVDGQMQGIYQELTPRGKVVVEGRYYADKKHGTWREWTDQGVLVLEQHWKFGRLDGTVSKFDDTGRLLTSATYKNGKADGPYRELRAGKPWLVGQFAADKRTGTWTEYDASGAVVLTATYKDGVLDGPWKQTAADGVVTEGALSAGRRTGTWTRTPPGGQPQHTTYKIL